jgi:hypothetical protein
LGEVTFRVPADKEEEMGITNASPTRLTNRNETKRFIHPYYAYYPEIVNDLDDR